MPDWGKADREIVETIVQESETYLQGQLTIAASADQRAAVLGGIFAASGTAIIGALIAGFQIVTDGIILAGLVSGVLFLGASGLCLVTALPVPFYLPGNEPENWYDDVANNTPIVTALGDVAEDAQKRIEKNNRVLERNSKFFFAGALVGIVAPVIGLVLWAVSYLIGA